ncbi:MAG: SpoIIE family protein phosphatase [bacterium]|nr:SpoIIE family protein phosphatase [bacterium]
MSKLKNNGLNLKLIGLAVIGIIFTCTYFWLMRTSPLHEFLKPVKTKEEIVGMARSFFSKMEVDFSKYDRVVSAGLDKNILSYAQYYKNGLLPLNESKETSENTSEKTPKEASKQEAGKVSKPRPAAFPALVPGFWTIRWKLNDRSQISWASRFFEIRYDFTGRLIGFQDRRNIADSAVTHDMSSEEDALFYAQYFLNEAGLVYSSVELSSKEIKHTNRGNLYKFTFSSKFQKHPAFDEKYTVEIQGEKTVAYSQMRRIDRKKAPALPAKNSNGKAIQFAIAWVIIVLALVICFIKKLRRDELEFSHALWTGVGAAVLTGIIQMGNNLDHGVWGALLISAIIGVLVLLAALVVFPVAQSQCRSVWPEKLTVADHIFQGRISVREAGVAILRAFFLMGVVLLVRIGLLLLVSNYNLGLVILESDMVNMFQSPARGISSIFKIVLLSVFVVLTLFSFWPAFLKEKIQGRDKQKGVLLFFLGLSFLMVINFELLEPSLLTSLLVLPLVVIWVVIVYKYDVITVFLTFMGIQYMSGVGLIYLIPGSFSSLIVIAGIVVGVSLFGMGIYLLYRPRSTADYDTYVPEYVSRIAEKERMYKELEIARSVQMRFLPHKVPDFPNLEIVSLCQPAMEVGGDYYDFIQMDDRHMSVLIGDVSGKGVSAAFYMTMVKGIIKTLAKSNRQPADLLAQANEIFYENAPRNVFITIIYGIFDLKEKVLTFASAGHNPLILLRHSKGKTEMVNPRGIALGLNHGKKYKSIIEEQCIPIEEGDLFVFYTDGVSESMNMQQEIFGEERLCEVIEKSANLPPRAIQRYIMEAVATFSGKAPQHDDFTMVVVKVRHNKS